MMNQNNPDPIASAPDQAQHLAAPHASGRELYATPRLTSYGRFQHITAACMDPTLQGENYEGAIDEGDA